MFTTGLLKLSKDQLATNLALWNSLESFNLVSKKMKEFIGKDTNLLEKDMEVMKQTYLKNKSEDELRIELFSNIAEILKVPLPEKITTLELENISARIEESTLILLKGSDKEFKGNSIDDLVLYIISKTMNDLQEKFKSKNSEEQDKIAKEIFNNLKEMPPEMREKLKSELGVEELTNDSIKKAMLAGSFAAAFTIVVQVAGFSAYVIAVKTLAAVAGFIGITLPFAAYTTLTSMIAFVSNPFIAIAAVCGVGYLLKRYADKKIQCGVTPFIVGQIAMSAADENQVTGKSLKGFIMTYNQKFQVPLKQTA